MNAVRFDHIQPLDRSRHVKFAALEVDDAIFIAQLTPERVVRPVLLRPLDLVRPRVNALTGLPFQSSTD